MPQRATIPISTINATAVSDAEIRPVVSLQKRVNNDIRGGIGKGEP